MNKNKPFPLNVLILFECNNTYSEGCPAEGVLIKEFQTTLVNQLGLNVSVSSHSKKSYDKFYEGMSTVFVEFRIENFVPNYKYAYYFYQILSGYAGIAQLRSGAISFSLSLI